MQPQSDEHETKYHLSRNVYLFQNLFKHFKLWHLQGQASLHCFLANTKTYQIILSRYLRGLMGTFNERAEYLMDELTKLADSKKEAKMLHLFNHVTLDIITKVARFQTAFLLVICHMFPCLVTLTCSTAHRSHYQKIVFLQRTLKYLKIPLMFYY